MAAENRPEFVTGFIESGLERLQLTQLLLIRKTRAALLAASRRAGFSDLQPEQAALLDSVRGAIRQLDESNELGAAQTFAKAEMQLGIELHRLADLRDRVSARLAGDETVLLKLGAEAQPENMLLRPVTSLQLNKNMQALFAGWEIKTIQDLLDMSPVYRRLMISSFGQKALASLSKQVQDLTGYRLDLRGKWIRAAAEK